MLIQFALIISVLLQFGAFFITISLIPKTRFNIAWVSISIGFFLMALRRLSEIMIIMGETPNAHQTTLNSWIAVVISIAMFISSFYIRKIFMLLNRISKLSRQNEARVLRAIISTEEKERKFFAKELHDGLGPILSSMKMTLSAIDKEIVGETNREIIVKSELAVDSAIITTKEISNHLNPQLLERFGIEKALQSFVNNITTNSSLKFDITSNMKKERVDYTIEVILYRILCELINNTLKHASASRVDIAIIGSKGRIECSYKDNGIGFDLNNEIPEGMGLINIKSRVKSLNGTINIESRNPIGTFITIEFPI